MAPRADRRRIALALAVSLLLHALLSLFVLVHRRGPSSRPEQPITFELVEVPRPAAAPGPAAGAGASSPAPTPSAITRSRGGPQVSSAPRPGIAPPGRGVGSGPSRPEPGSPAWAESEGLEPAEPGSPSGRASLLPGPVRDGMAAGIGPEQPGMRDPSLPGDPAEAGKRAKAEVDRYLAQAKAVERADFPHAYWTEVRERLERKFQVDWSMLDKGRAERPLVSESQLREFGKTYGQNAGRYGASGNPFGNEPDAAGAPAPLADEIRGLRPGKSLSPAARTLLETGHPDNSLWGRHLTTLVLISQDGDGSILGVQLLESSGNGAYDRLVLQQAWGLAGEAGSGLGPPPAQGRKTVWAFNTDFRLVPPLPVVGCQFDARFVPTNCFYPLKRSVHSKVQLRAVY